MVEMVKMVEVVEMVKLVEFVHIRQAFEKRRQEQVPPIQPV